MQYTGVQIQCQCFFFFFWINGFCSFWGPHWWWRSALSTRGLTDVLDPTPGLQRHPRMLAFQNTHSTGSTGFFLFFFFFLRRPRMDIREVHTCTLLSTRNWCNQSVIFCLVAKQLLSYLTVSISLELGFSLPFPVASIAQIDKIKSNKK